MPLKCTPFFRECARCGAQFRLRDRSQQKRFCSRSCWYAYNATPMADRFWQRVEQNGLVVRPDLGACWTWKGTLSERGYGLLARPGHAAGHTGAHRFSWELHNGPIPEGMEICHRCDNPSCVRPDHLFVGSHADNMADAVEKRRMRNPGSPGSWNGNARLTDDLVRQIRHRCTETTQRQVALEFGISQSMVGNIVRRINWTHLP